MDHINISINEIIPKGNFEPIILRLKEKIDIVVAEYNLIPDNSYKKRKKVKQLIELFKSLCTEFPISTVLEDAIKEKNVWDMEEAMSCLLYTKLMMIRIHNIIQNHFNGTVMDDDVTQLNSYIQESPEIYGDIVII